MKLLNAVSNKAQIQLFDADFTYYELEQQMDILNSKLNELQKEGLIFTGYGIEERVNRIVIYLPTDDEKSKRLFKKTIHEKYLQFEINNTMLRRRTQNLLGGLAAMLRWGL